jgi:hypothetical protein
MFTYKEVDLVLLAAKITHFPAEWLNNIIHELPVPFNN